jgi:hypothetical protein
MMTSKVVLIIFLFQTGPDGGAAATYVPFAMPACIAAANKINENNFGNKKVAAICSETGY